MTPLNEQQDIFFNTVVSMVDGLPEKDNSSNWVIRWGEGPRELASGQEKVDQFLGFLFDRIIFEQGTVTINDRIHTALDAGQKLNPEVVKVVDSPSQKALQTALTTLSNSYVQFGVKLAVCWATYRLTRGLMDRSFTYIRGNLVPIAVIKITNHVSAKVIGTISKVYDYKWPIFLGAWGLSWVPQFRPVMDPLQKGAWQVIKLLSRITDLPGNLVWALGKKALSSTEGGIVEANKKLHRLVNQEQAEAIGKARQLWIEIVKQKIRSKH